MTHFPSVVGEVEDALRSGDPGRRRETLRRMTDLFVTQAPALNEGHVAVFDEVILRLASNIEFRARVELADRLADVGNAPRNVVRDLALDSSIEVAKPVLERSTRLTEDDLIAVAESKGQRHLLAISRRAAISERVTDVLVDRGDSQVVRSVAGNQGARFSEHGVRQLVQKAQADTELQERLQKRHDLSSEQMGRLVEMARERARQSLKGGAADQDLVEAALGQATAGLTDNMTRGVLIGDLTEAAKRVAAIVAKQPTLTEAEITSWIREGKVEDALAGMAHLAGIPAVMAGRAYDAPNFDPLLFLVRAVQFNWTTFKMLLTHKAGRTPPMDVMRSAYASFEHLTVPTAQRVVRFTAARDSLSAA